MADRLFTRSGDARMFESPPPPNINRPNVVAQPGLAAAGQAAAIPGILPGDPLGASLLGPMLATTKSRPPETNPGQGDGRSPPAKRAPKRVLVDSLPAPLPELSTAQVTMAIQKLFLQQEQDRQWCARTEKAITDHAEKIDLHEAKLLTLQQATADAVAQTVKNDEGLKTRLNRSEADMRQVEIVLKETMANVDTNLREDVKKSVAELRDEILKTQS